MNKLRNNLTQLCSIVVFTVFIAATAQAQTPAAASTNHTEANGEPGAQPRFALTPAGLRLMPAAGPRTNVGSRSTRMSLMPMAAGTNLQVLGSGTIGRLAKWTGLTSSNSFIGDTTIFEDKNGLVGIGTDTPTSRLTVAGMIQTTLGGIKFPDGTVQTTAALTGLQSVFHNATLQGNGTSASPLGLAVPLNLTGAVPPVFDSFIGVINATNTAPGGVGMSGIGGDAGNLRGGLGMVARGGQSSNNGGGTGLLAVGGDSNSTDPSNYFGGDGVTAAGGGSSSGRGGVGVSATGGDGKAGGPGLEAEGGIGLQGEGGAGLGALGGLSRGKSGIGLFASGGGHLGDVDSNGANGVVTEGSKGSGAGKIGGDGLFATAGLGENGATNGRAGAFVGNVRIVGDLEVTGTKNFKIDHPLDPENKYLNHAAIESSEVLNVYSGNVTTNENGEAIVTLPDWFEAVNRDFRYQLTVVGQFAQAIVAEKIKHNRFTIKANASNVEVSWQVTGVRSDAAMRRHPFKVEEEKPEPERGSFLSPDAYDQPEERSVEWARNPSMMQRMKARREKQVETLKHKTGNDR